MDKRTNDPSYGKYHEANVIDGGDLTAHIQTYNYGYGFTHYQLVGTKSAVERFIQDVNLHYPPQGYGGGFTPPEEIVPDLWYAIGQHSNTSD